MYRFLQMRKKVFYAMLFMITSILVGACSSYTDVFAKDIVQVSTVSPEYVADNLAESLKEDIEAVVRNVIRRFKSITNGGFIKSGWIEIGNNRYKLDENGRFYKNCWKKISNTWYFFDQRGAVYTGWHYINGYKYYFDRLGRLVQDTEKLIGPQDSYFISVNREKNQVMIFAKDGDNGYTIPVKSFVCSVGLNNSTITGTYSTTDMYEWRELVGHTYGQYAVRIHGPYLFHSVPGSAMNKYSISASEFNKLGEPASHGCVRLCVRDAKWIYDHCKRGTVVTISDTAYMPFDKPVMTKIPEGQNWDPTDPGL